nr:nuclear pore complex-interacting protein family member A2-like isoform X1 [Symphalangus syndactylus]
MTNETIVPVPHRRKLRLKGMVKLSIVLTPQFLSHDQDQLTKELQQHVKSGTCPCEYLRKVLSPRVTLRNPGSSGRKERPEAGRESWLGRTRNQVSFLKTVLKSRNVHDRSMDVHRRAWRSNSRSQEGQRSTRMHTKKRVSSFPGIKIGMEDLYTSLRYMEAKVQTEVHKVTTKVNSHYKISGQRKTPKEEKLRMKECEQAEKDRQLSEAEENGKSIMKEIDTDMKLFHAAERLRRRAEDYYRRKIAPSARKPHANWVSLFVFLAFGHSLPGQDMDVFFCPQLCARALQRKMAERKAASKQQRCEMREKQRVPQRLMSREPVQGRPGLENPFWRGQNGCSGASSFLRIALLALPHSGNFKKKEGPPGTSSNSVSSGRSTTSIS